MKALQAYEQKQTGLFKCKYLPVLIRDRTKLTQRIWFCSLLGSYPGQLVLHNENTWLRLLIPRKIHTYSFKEPIVCHHQLWTVPTSVRMICFQLVSSNRALKPHFQRIHLPCTPQKRSQWITSNPLRCWAIAGIRQRVACCDQCKTKNSARLAVFTDSVWFERTKPNSSICIPHEHTTAWKCNNKWT